MTTRLNPLLIAVHGQSHRRLVPIEASQGTVTVQPQVCTTVQAGDRDRRPTTKFMSTQVKLNSGVSLFPGRGQE